MAKIRDEIKKFTALVSERNRIVQYYIEVEENAGIPQMSLELQKKFTRPRFPVTGTYTTKKNE